MSSEHLLDSGHEQKAFDQTGKNFIKAYEQDKEVENVFYKSTHFTKALFQLGSHQTFVKD